MKEMAEHKRKNSKMKIYFLYILWQRRINNNTNILIVFLKSANFRKVSR